MREVKRRSRFFLQKRDVNVLGTFWLDGVLCVQFAVDVRGA